MEDREIQSRLSRYHFYHSIPLNERVITPGWDGVTRLVNMTLGSLRRLDLKGKRVLDIGCRDGIFSFEAEKLGAREVIAIDSDLSAAAVEFLIPYFGSQVRMHEMNLLDLRPESFGLFDLIIFPGVLYHLRYPMWSLKLIKDLLADDGVLVMETAIFEDHGEHALLYCPTGSDSPYEPTSCTFFNIKGLNDTLRTLGLTTRNVELLNDLAAPAGSGQPLKRGLTSFLKPRFLLKPRENLDQKPTAWRPTINRATFTCDLTPHVIDRIVDRYWHGTHKLHSVNHGAIA